MNEFTILIPVYNEEENLPELEQVLRTFIPSALIPTRVLFVNDGSTDNSENLLSEITKRNPNFTYISFKKNLGLSAALKAGFDRIETPLLGYMDSDLQTHPEDFNILIEQIPHYDFITGIRTNRKDPFLKKAASSFANSFRNMFTGDGIRDTGCPLKIIRTDFAKRIPMFDGMHRFLPALVMLQKGRIHQIPVRHFPRKKGKSKFGIRNRILGPLISCLVFLWIRRNYIHYEIKE